MITYVFENKEQKLTLHIWSNVSGDIPQGYIAGLLLFNIFIDDIFLFIEKT